MAELLYSVEREYSHSIDRLWHAWTDAGALETWYHPAALAVLPGSVVSEPEVGGWWTAAIDVAAHGFVAYFFGVYTAVEPRVRLSHTMLYTQSADEFAARDLTGPHHDVVVDFESRGESAWVRFSQFGELPEGQAEQAQAGMESYFDSLGAFLS